MRNTKTILQILKIHYRTSLGTTIIIVYPNCNNYFTGPILSGFEIRPSSTWVYLHLRWLIYEFLEFRKTRVEHNCVSLECCKRRNYWDLICQWDRGMNITVFFHLLLRVKIIEYMWIILDMPNTMYIINYRDMTIGIQIRHYLLECLK